MDDDVLDDGKVCSLGWLLMKEFVLMREKQIEELREKHPNPDLSELPLPALPYWRCRQIMTRPDFLEGMPLLCSHVHLLTSLDYLNQAWTG